MHFSISNGGHIPYFSNFVHSPFDFQPPHVTLMQPPPINPLLNMTLIPLSKFQFPKLANTNLWCLKACLISYIGV